MIKKFSPLYDYKEFYENLDTSRTIIQSDTVQYYFKFQNGYSAIVTKDNDTLGSKCDLFELRIYYDDAPCYLTSLNNQNIGYLSNEKVLECLKIVQKQSAPEGLRR